MTHMAAKLSEATEHLQDTHAYGAMDERKRKEHLQDLVEMECRMKELIEAYNAKWREYTISKQMDIAQV